MGVYLEKSETEFKRQLRLVREDEVVWGFNGSLLRDLTQVRLEFLFSSVSLDQYMMAV